MAGYAHNIRTLPIAWAEFGRSVGEVEHTVEQETGKDVLLIGMDRYFIASEMAFYVPGGINSVQASVGRGVVGGNSLMYDYWSKSADLQGRTAVLVALKRGDLDQESLPQRFSKLTDITEQKVTKQGAPVGSFFYRVGYGLKACVPSSATVSSCETTSDD
jgi:dolichol-phosphate mannosyltransferase